MKYKFAAKDAVLKDGIEMKIKDYNTKAQYAKQSFTIIECDRDSGGIKNAVNDRVYFVISGKGSFYIDEIEYKVEAGDVIVIPKNTEYSFEGNMKLFLTNTPAFDKGAEVKVLNVKPGVDLNNRRFL